MIDFLQYGFNGVLVGMLYAMVALGFIVIYRAARIFNLAQGEIVMVGAFLISWIIAGLGLPIWLGLLLALAGSALVGILIERLFFRPIVGQPLFSLIMVTIGLLILLQGTVLLIAGPQPRPFPTIFPRAALRLGPFVFDHSFFWGGLAAVVIVVGLHWFFARTKWGLRLTAVAEDHQIAQSLGISVKQAMAIAWALSAVLATLSTIVLLDGKPLTFFVGDIGFRALPVALLGGVESIGGVLIAGVVVGVAEALAGVYLDPLVGGGVANIVPFLAMLIILLIKPSGLFGWQTIERV